jgi:hypothetical protein
MRVFPYEYRIPSSRNRRSSSAAPALNSDGRAGVEGQRGRPKMDTRGPDFVTQDVPDAA